MGEEKANDTWGKYKEALDVTANLQGSMDGLKAEIDAMGKQLAEEQGNISVYTDRQTKATATKAQAESELKAAQAVLAEEESSRVALAAEVKAHSGSVGVVKKEIEDIELAIAKVELEKGNRDHTIKVLQDEIAEQDEVINKLRKDVEEANIQQESILSNLKRKQGDAIAEMSEQIDALGKMKSKIEKDKGQIMNEIADARAATDEVMRAQASSDKSNKTMLEALNAINKKVDNANLTLGDFAASKNKIAVENSDLLRIVGDLDNNLNICAKQKSALAAQLNDVKALCDNESRERGLLLGKYRNLEHELDGARCALEEEAAGRENTLRLVAKAEGEAQCWRQKYETDAVAKGEELEMTKMKLTARLTEAEAAIDNLNAKLNQVEKAKGKIASEIAEMTSSLDQAQVLNAAMDRKAKQFDKVIGEWKGKVDRLSFDLDVSQKETRNASSELFKVKSAYEETMLQLEEVRRENKTLSNEIKDIMD